MPKRNTLGYNGNTNLKKPGHVIQFTYEQGLEMAKCKADPIYFARNYMKIQHVDHGLISLDLYPYQEEVIRKFKKSRKNIVLQSRQSGKTTTATAIILHYILFSEYKLVGILSNKGDTSREILDRIKLAYENIPVWMQSGIIEWNKGNIELENGCRVIAASTSSSSIRGKSCSLLYIDEAAFVENWDQFYSSTYPTIASGKTTQLLFTSTANGLNHFYQFYEGARKGVNGFAHTNVTWKDVPGRDEAWYQETLEGMNFNMEKFNQEFNNEFLGSSGTLISGAVLKMLQAMEPIYKNAEGFKQYIKPAAKHVYALVADVSKGKGLDYSAFSVFDITATPYEQVATFRSNMITPTDYAIIIDAISRTYNNAYVLVENNNMGIQVAHLLWQEHDCENLLKTINRGRDGKQITLSGDPKAERGVKTTKPIKMLGCSVLKLIVEQFQLIIHDIETIYELSTFSRKNDSWEAEQGKHDDMVMGLVLFAWMSQTKSFTQMTDVDVMKALQEWKRDEADAIMNSAGFIRQDGTEGMNGDSKLERYGGELWEVIEDSFGTFW